MAHRRTGEPRGGGDRARFRGARPAARSVLSQQRSAAVALVRDIAGEDYLELPASNMGGEDFSYVLEQVPGAMAFLGVAPAEADASTCAPLHNPGMMVDEAVLPRGVALHCAFATQFLEKGWE